MKIPIELASLPNEILSSWLIRNSIANGSDPGSWVSGIWFNYRAWTRDMDRHLSTDKINKLSKITSLSKEQIRNMTLEPIVENITSNYSLNPQKSWSYIIPTGARGTSTTNGMHFCTECLKEDTPYLKKEWRLAWNVACPKHKELLLHKCQKCDKTFAPHKVNYLDIQVFKCTHCGFDLRQSKTTVANSEVLVFQSKLNNVAFHNIFDTDFPIVAHTQEELFNTIRIFISFFKNLLRLDKRHLLFEKINFNDEINLARYQKGTTFEAMSSVDREQMLLMVSRLFEFTMDEIRQFLMLDLQITKKSLLSQILTTSRTINFLANDLDNGIAKIVLADRTSVIRPRTKDEVEALMEEISPYI